MNLNSIKYKLIRKLFNFPLKRTPQRGFIIIQIDGLSYEMFQYALKKNYLPKIKKILNKNYSCKKFYCGIPSNTPYFQKILLYGDTSKYPGFRWYNKKEKKYFSFKLPETAEIEEKKIKEKNYQGILKGGASYYNLFSGDADRNYLVLSKLFTISLKSKLSAFKLFILTLLNIPAMIKVLYWSLKEIYHEICDFLYYYIYNIPQRNFKFFPFLRIFNNVIINEYITQGACVEIICGTPKIYLTYNAYDEASHQRGADSKSAMHILKLIDKSVWRIFKLANKKGNLRKYDFYILSDHGQKKSLPFSFVFRKSFKEAISKYENIIENNENYKEISVFPIIEKIKLLSEEKKIPKFISKLFPDINKYKKVKINNQLEGKVKVIDFGSFSQIYFTEFSKKLSFEKINELYPFFILHLISHKGVKFITMIDENDNTLILGKKGFAKIKNGKFIEKTGTLPVEILYLEDIEELTKTENSGDILIFGNIINGRLINFEGQMSSHGTFYNEETSCMIIFPEYKKKHFNEVKDTYDLYKFFRDNY